MTDFPLNPPIKLRDWLFKRDCDADWAKAELPHSPFTADPDGQNCWFGVCEYRREIRVDNPDETSRYAVYFRGAMHSAVVRIDGSEIARHSGGFLPFEADVSGFVMDGKAHLISVELDNRDNPDVPPGKPFAELDFCWYGGLYREVELRRYPSVCITDPVSACEVAGGGVFVRTLRADENEAEISVKVHVRNLVRHTRRTRLGISIRNAVSHETQVGYGTRIEIGPRESEVVETSLIVARPSLWSPASPNLYFAEVTVTGENGKIIDIVRERFGIRTIGMSRAGGLRVNGVRIRPRGTNRHQEHPYVGYAVPAAAQRRDAVRIKEAGFDYVRLSHYPQSPDFLDACDELGILVMNSIPGWQFFGGEAFVAACMQNARDTIRRDRNHPSVILWELSLNETPMPADFIAKMHRIGHEEYPGDQMFTCGWMKGYDVFVHARQHGLIHKWKDGNRAMVVSEYGDWEYYASNEGFDQKTKRGLLDPSKNSRARRADGERKMLQQAANFAEALADTLSCPAVTDGQWVMFDYARGYNPEQATCGAMDFFRLPKFACHFYRSQRDAKETIAGREIGAVVFIASLWTSDSSPDVRVFSNCDEVELRLNGEAIARKRVDRGAKASILPHPPFCFNSGKFDPGTLEAVGYIGGRAVAEHKVSTPGAPMAIRLSADLQNTPPAKGEPDAILVRAEIVDENGSICVGETCEVAAAIEGEGWRLAGPDRIRAESGIAAFVAVKSAKSGACEIRCASEGMAIGALELHG